MWNQFGLNENLFDFQKICDSEGILISLKRWCITIYHFIFASNNK